MELELAPIERSSVEPHDSGESNVITKSSDRQNNASGGQNIWKKSKLAYHTSKSRYEFCLTIININLIYM